VSDKVSTLRLAAVLVGLLALGALGLGMLTVPTKGTLLVLLSARAADHMPATVVEIHAQDGWRTVARLVAGSVPVAPDTRTAAQAELPVQAYDAIRLAGVRLPVRIRVSRTVLAPVLIAIAGGHPVEAGAYAGGEAVSLGLNELSGHLREMPQFRLADQFGRPFTNSSIAGHDVILAAFHTSCHESCPIYTGLFLQLRKRLPPSVLLVEATVSPEEDTPEVLRDYAGRIGASWTFVTGETKAMAAFWKPFDVELSSGDVHRSELAVIDSHGYARSHYLGVPDVGGSLPPALLSQLNSEGESLLTSHGNGWGVAQVTDTLGAIGGLATPSSSNEGEAGAFRLRTLDGRSASLADHRGRPVLINFWASYCVPCRQEMPLIERTAGRQAKAVVLLVDERDQQLAALSFVSELKLRSTVLFDGDGRVGDQYGISGLPTTFFVRADGTIESRYVGEISERALSTHLAAIGA